MTSKLETTSMKLFTTDTIVQKTYLEASAN
jgi:hypothetical protein